jgi:HK97 gp10 family phage protein
VIRTNAKTVSLQWEAKRRSLLKAAQAIVQNATFKLTAEAKKESPVRTGFLRKSINAEIGPFRGRVQASASYAGYVHDGTRHQAPNPFLSRARATTVNWLRGQRIKIE